MNKIIYAILISIILFACNNVQKTSFTGEVLNFNNDDFYLVKSKTKILDSINVFDGKFYKEIDAKNAKIKSLMIGNNYNKVFLSPNKSLEMCCDLYNFDNSLIFKGELKEENEIMHQIITEFGNINRRIIFQSQAEASLQYIDSIYNSFNDLFKNLTDKKQLDSNFLFLAENMIKYEIANLNFIVGFNNNLYNDSAFNQIIDVIFIEDERLLDLDEYQLFVCYYTGFKSNYLIAEQNKDDRLAHITAKLTYLETLNSEKIKDYIVYDLFKMTLISVGVEEFEKHSSYFYDNNHTQEFIDDINRIYADKKLLARGSYAPDFTFFDIDSTQVSLSDFRGKYVYIDFWATSCKACRDELPHFSKLQSDYKDENIVFLSLSADNNWERWSSVVKAELGDGVHLFTGAGSYKGVFKDYQIQAIPACAFIDKEGKFIESRAPRPSTQKVRDLFDEYLK